MLILGVIVDNIEGYRAAILKDLFSSKTVETAWSVWEPLILQKTKNLTDPSLCYNLGPHLSDIFTSTSETGRGQEVLSAAGNAWEALVCWYLNLGFSGTKAVAMRQKRTLVPACLRDSATISYGPDQTNTESDLIVVVFPEGFQFPVDNKSLTNLSREIAPKISSFEMGIVQCKTNWNDNAQIPMLWDMVYRAQGFNDHSISIGRNGFSIYDLKRFTYSFVTVPSQKKPFSQTGMAVKRVRNLSGGNYWGKKTQNGVASNINEIFSRNFRSAFDRPIIDSIASAISGKLGVFDR